MKRKKTMNRAGARGNSPLAKVTAAIVMMLTLAVSGAWAQEPTKYTVTMAEDTEDATNWTVSPTEAAEGTTVTATYNGTRHVKSVTAVTKSPLATPLTIEALTDGKIVVNIGYGRGTLSTGMKYSLDGGKNKTTIYETTEIPVTAGQKVQFYGNGTSTTEYGNTTEVKLRGSGDGFKTKVYGNIMSLLDETGYETAIELSEEYVFYQLFIDNTTLTDASGLLLPATTLTNGCYMSMFNNCNNLTAAPELPATTLARECYNSMFSGCTSLTAAPAELPATTLEANCCYAMFYDCKKLTTAPELPATTLAGGCYSYMFYGCTSLTAAPELPATTLAEDCYAFMFYECSSLTTAPKLPAETLADGCYHKMFNNCSNLSSVTCLATSGINTDGSTEGWLQGVAATGTFTAAPNADWGDASINTIPSGWTRLNPDGSTYVTLATPLTMEALTDGTIKVNSPKSGMKYSLNSGEKTAVTTTAIDVKAGDKVAFYGNGTSITSYNGTKIAGGTAQTKVYGNIMSLVDETGYETATELPDKDFVFYCLFLNNTTLTDASGLLLPATKLAHGCYTGMFGNCTGLTTAPVLPATTLLANCYNSMFYNCLNLASVTCLATSGINVDDSTYNWLNNAGSKVTGTKTFTADPNADWGDASVNTIPSGWTRLNPDGTAWVAP
ncbi:MAG: leucine-rich repeat protein [Bacteroidales bacterium]|nr:leucine-rich repeat protein [Bacteroidales bacterium]